MNTPSRSFRTTPLLQLSSALLLTLALVACDDESPKSASWDDIVSATDNAGATSNQAAANDTGDTGTPTSQTGSAGSITAAASFSCSNSIAPMTLSNGYTTPGFQYESGRTCNSGFSAWGALLHTEIRQVSQKHDSDVAINS